VLLPIVAVHTYIPRPRNGSGSAFNFFFWVPPPLTADNPEATSSLLE